MAKMVTRTLKKGVKFKALVKEGEETVRKQIKGPAKVKLTEAQETAFSTLLEPTGEAAEVAPEPVQQEKSLEEMSKEELTAKVTELETALKANPADEEKQKLIAQLTEARKALAEKK